MKVMGIYGRTLCPKDNLGDYSNSNVLAKHISSGNTWYSGTEH